MSTDTPPHQISLDDGSPLPLGATPTGRDTVNFAVSSQMARSVTLCLFSDLADPARETSRTRLPNRTGDVWHGEISGIPAGSTYGYRVDGVFDTRAGLYFNPDKLLLDPYAKQIDGASQYHPSYVSCDESGERCTIDSAPHAPRALVPTPDDYDWGSDQHPRIPRTDAVFYEMHVKGFSKLNPEVPEEIRGTYAGLGHPASVEYFKQLGITSVQLLPVHQHLDDGFLLDRGLVNYWGYNTLGFFAPESGYASSDDPVTEFRDMVKSLHAAGIEVILDVVYNHTCEAGVDGPTVLLRGFDNVPYYHTAPSDPGIYHDYTGCGNSVDISHPRSLRLVMDSLRYWVEEMHVDGFRFDLAVEMGRKGENYDRRAAFFQAASQDPVLSRTKLIAEPWDLGPGGYQIGNFPTDWAELNGKFRDAVRRFWRGDPGVSGDFAARLTGSEDLFAHNRRTPGASHNFITSHDGFTLADLTAYNHKYNLANGENNADGDSHNISYNHGVEGETKDKKILALRRRQVRNFLATTILSQGVPFLLGGDERLRSQGGNNNGYCQDNEISWLSWDLPPEAKAMQKFTKELLDFRRATPALRRTRFFTGKKVDGNDLPDVCWLRPDGGVKEIIDWESDKACAFAMLIHGSGDDKALLFFFNARQEDTEFHFPDNPTCQWKLIVDTHDAKGGKKKAKCKTSLKLADRSLQVWQEA